eukprot:gb/GECG01002254.1/.p1 GENE.gb/GECG01002254.1/~~gb/GECG01002254.1/.p1  ORF type:complete len:259 (+),score=25.18 gb/GECG01002254.1/:1-777(+)
MILERYPERNMWRNTVRHSIGTCLSRQILAASDWNACVTVSTAVQSHARSICSGTTNGIKWSDARRTNSVQMIGNGMEAHVTVLGTTAGIPTPFRGSSAYVVQFQGRKWLVDAGEGTFLRLSQMESLSVADLEGIFITHLHGDHVFGLHSLLATYFTITKAPFAEQWNNLMEETHQQGRRARSKRKPLKVYGPKGISNFIFNGFPYYTNRQKTRFPLVVVELLAPDEEPPKVCESRKEGHLFGIGFVQVLLRPSDESI